jgi:hypothetical protein
MVIIVVPIYTQNFNQFEKISLMQLQFVLGKYEKCFVAPKSMKFDDKNTSAGFIVERFDDMYFESTMAYSQLLLSPEFYQRFNEYKFLLIHQLDAFVFSDKLTEFCMMGFDYIGAPVPQSLWSPIKKRVGNGGLSLRKISTMIKLVQNKQSIIKKAKDNYPDVVINSMFQYEDKFFAICNNLNDVGIDVPKTKIALNFSVEYNESQRYKTLEKDLPFGCHGWYKDNFDIWWPIIEKYGFRYTEDVNFYRNRNSYGELRKIYITRCLYERIMYRNNFKQLEKILQVVLKTNLTYSIWGYGIMGKKCVDLLNRCKIKIHAVYDMTPNGCVGNSNIAVEKPNYKKMKMKKSVIIIATTKYEETIEKILCGLNFKKNIDFLLFSDIEKRIVQKYYESILKL